MENKILVIGAAFVDVIMDIPNIPEPGGDVTATFKDNIVGGSAFNVYGALQYEKADADLFVPVGRGQYANVVREAFAEKKISMLIERDEKDNGWDLSLVEPSGERTFITVPGIDQFWKDDWFDAIDLNDYQYFYISGYETENIESTEVILNKLESRRDDAYVLFDASPRVRYMDQNVIDQFLQHNNIIHCNEDEIGYLSNAEKFDYKLADIYTKTESPVIVTLGSKGACLFDHGQKEIISGEHADVVNTIGAGDTHCGGILAGLQNGMSIHDAIQLGNKLSAQVVKQRSGSL